MPLLNRVPKLLSSEKMPRVCYVYYFSAADGKLCRIF